MFIGNKVSLYYSKELDVYIRDLRELRDLMVRIDATALCEGK